MDTATPGSESAETEDPQEKKMRTGFHEEEGECLPVCLPPRCVACGDEQEQNGKLQDERPARGQSPAVIGTWVCPRHAWMCSRPAPFTEKAIFPPLDCFAHLLEVKRAYLYESMSGFCAMGWRWTGMEGGTQDARSNPGKMGESSGEEASWCTEDMFWRQLQISVIHVGG